MAELTTKKNDKSVEDFIASVDNKTRRADAESINEIMRVATGEAGSMWGDRMVGFGSYDYTYASGHSGSWFATGFSPGKRNLTVYFMPGFERYSNLMSKLGKFKTGKSCMYINKLADVDEEVLKELITISFREMTGVGESKQ